MTASELINENIHVLRVTDTVECAIDLLCQQGMTELPVIRNKKLFNYARLEALYGVPDKTAELKSVLKENSHAAVVMSQAHIYELIPLLATNQLTAIAICDDNYDFLGVVDQKKINEIITNSLTYRGFGAVVVINVASADYAPSIIARWIEENGAKVLGMMVTQMEESRLRVNIKINTTQVRSIIATFQRQGFQVEQVYMAEDSNEEASKAIDMALKFFDL